MSRKKRKQKKIKLLTWLDSIMSQPNIVKEPLRKDMPRIEGLLKEGGRLVIAGAKASNFPPEIREHPQLEFWDSTDPSSRNRTLPTNAKAVIVLRFVGHPLFESIQTQAKARHILMIPGLLSTGEIRRIVYTMLPELAPPPKPVEEPVQTVVVPPAPPPVVAPEDDMLPQEMQPKKLAPLPPMPRRKRLAGPRVPTGPKPGDEKVVDTRPRDKVTPMGPPPKESIFQPVTTTEPEAALKVLDDAMAALQLAREQLANVVKENGRLKLRINGFVKFIQEGMEK